MSEKIYGVLKSKVLIDEEEYTSKRSHLTHYNLITVGDEEHYQVNIDIQSNQNRPNVHMLCIENYQNDIIKKFDDLGSGFLELDSKKDGLALDYLRQELFPKENLFKSNPLSADEITKTLDKYLEEHENVIVFGTRYGPGYNEEKHYGRQRSIEENKPSTGVDDVHLNQGSAGFHAKSNGVYQDGALFVQNKDKTYAAFFFSFSEQCSNTDEKGNCI